MAGKFPWSVSFSIVAGILATLAHDAFAFHAGLSLYSVRRKSLRRDLVRLYRNDHDDAVRFLARGELDISAVGSCARRSAPGQSLLATTGIIEAPAIALPGSRCCPSRSRHFHYL